ncbi:hypothetical protein PGT21_011129 [Puccinia graminis f. sp. tritici]|uniref:Uncharacterized protein n=1 Tax=Puccinia graminis f. sp. tritici TaxID=56615 RepID=A0A5B0M8C1_PUCGR|nr:hypothetical protein PGT21_011129 [Puccinia graminis f. sp. tritici]
MYKKQTLLGPQASTGVDSSAARSRSRHGGLVRLADLLGSISPKARGFSRRSDVANRDLSSGAPTQKSDIGADSRCPI